MNKIRIFTIALLLCTAFSVRAEETELVPPGTLRLTLAPSFGFQVREFKGFEGQKVMDFNIGLGLEYSVNNWLEVQVLWAPGVNVWSQMENDGKYGFLSDVYGGIKFLLAGVSAPINSEKLRFAVAAGLKVPQVSRDSGDWEPDLHLWGSSLRLYLDFIFSPLFYLNLYTEAMYCPNQYYDGPNYSTSSVNHPLQMNFEMEGRFKQAAGEKIMLHWGVPLNLFTAPWINRNDNSAMDTVLVFGTGLFFTVSFTSLKFPIDLTLRYTAPLLGQYSMAVHRVSLLGRFYF